MELTHNLATAVWRPNFLLKHPQLRDQRIMSTARVPWVISALNPKNRPDSLDVSRCRWRIDGATGCGTCYFAVPLDLLPSLVPLRVFAYLPDQGDWPPALRTCLDAAASVPLRDGLAIADLGIARHLCRALEHHCVRQPGFWDRYRRLPFGSRLVFENISADVAHMRLTVVANHELELASRTIASLRESWVDILPPHVWPPTIDITRLRLVRQLHDTVSIVRVEEHDDVASESYLKHLGVSRTLIFKSVIDSYDHLYHELRFLLTTPSHLHIMPRPPALIVKRLAFGGRFGVMGFLLPYFPSGSIRDILPARQAEGLLPSNLKLEWCRQVTAALLHVQEAASTFIADLRPDNVLLAAHAVGGEERLLLCDFEQRGNWHEWCAPEVLFRQYAENIRTALVRSEGGSGSPAAPSASAVSVRARWANLLDVYARPNPSEHTVAYSTDETHVQAANRAWFALPRAAQEKAMVYSLGLFIYTVFEGLSNVRRNIVNQWPLEPDVEFPRFERTPAVIQDIVRRCAPEAFREPSLLPPHRLRVVRVGGFLYPEGRTKLVPGTEEAADAVLQTARAWWTTELERAEIFSESEVWRTGSFGQDRPTLREVMRALEEVSVTDLANKDALGLQSVQG